jgi:hypothetical protein
MSSGKTEAALRGEVEAHRGALAELVAVAAAVDAAAWNAAPADGKWSPAQVVEHLRLTYVVGRRELAGQGGMRVRTRWWQRLVFRPVFLGRILKSGRFPENVPAVSEIRPVDGRFDRETLIAALRDEGEAFLREAEGTAAGAGLTHPFLGRLGLADGVRFLAHHLRHHQRQLPNRRQDADGGVAGSSQ